FACPRGAFQRGSWSLSPSRSAAPLPGPFLRVSGGRKTGVRIRSAHGAHGQSQPEEVEGKVMQIKLELIAGLPKKEIVERLHYHQRQGEVSDRAVGFYLLDMEKRKLFRPIESVTVWAQKHLPQTHRPD